MMPKTWWVQPILSPVLCSPINNRWYLWRDWIPQRKRLIAFVSILERSKLHKIKRKITKLIMLSIVQVKHKLSLDEKIIIFEDYFSLHQYFSNQSNSFLSSLGTPPKCLPHYVFWQEDTCGIVYWKRKGKGEEIWQRIFLF